MVKGAKDGQVFFATDAYYNQYTGKKRIIIH